MSALLSDCDGRDPAPDRRADNHRPRGKLRQHRAQVFDEDIEIVASIARPVAHAMTAQVEIDHITPGLDEGLGHVAPHLAGLAGTVQKQDGRIIAQAADLGPQRDTAKTPELACCHLCASLPSCPNAPLTRRT